MKAFKRMSASETFTLEFDGEAVQAGEIDVNDLAPSLLSFGDLCSAANAVLNGDRASVSVRVKAGFKQGSFGVDIHLLQTGIEHLRSFLGSSDVKDVKSILDTLGVMSDDLVKIEAVIGAPILGLLQIAKFVGHKRVKSFEQTAAGTTLQLDNGLEYVAKPAAWDMFQKPGVKGDLEKFSGPLRRDGFEEIRFKVQGRITAEIDKEDAAEFASLLPEEIEAAEGPLVNQVLQKRTWRIRQVAFDPTLRLWKFFQGKAPIRALMLDDDFVGRVSRHDVVFGSGDFLEVEVLVKTWATGNETYEIQRVIRRIEQPALPLENAPRSVPRENKEGPDALTP